MNPLHIWHEEVIQQALKQNDAVLVLLWGNMIIDKNNPLDFQHRKILLEKLFGDTIYIRQILDTPGDKQWVWDIVKEIDAIVEDDGIVPINTKQRNITGDENIHPLQIQIYGGDFSSDSAIVAIKEYQDILKYENITYLQVDRFKKTVFLEGQQYDISATTLREALVSKNWKLVELLTPKEIYNDLQQLFIK